MKNIFIILLLSGVYVSAFTQSKDIGLWIGPVVKYNINEKFRAEFEQQFRFNENISQYDFTFSEIAIRYKVFKYLDLKTLFRHSFIPAEETGSALEEYDRSRISLNASTGTKVFDTGIKAGYRLMYQHSWENGTGIVSNYFRNRFELEYNLCKLVDPYANYESYFRLDNRNEFRQNRYTFGLTWKVSDKLDIDSFYRYQNEINVNNPETEYIIGVGLVYMINLL